MATQRWEEASVAATGRQERQGAKPTGRQAAGANGRRVRQTAKAAGRPATPTTGRRGEPATATTGRRGEPATATTGRRAPEAPRANRRGAPTEIPPTPPAPAGRRGGRGERTRRRLLEAAEEVFAEHSYHDASIVKITEAAGVAQGTFYLYFSSKQAIFEELVDDLNARVRHAMTEASRGAKTRLEAERLGFAAFFEFTAAHPGLYRVIRQAEFASPQALHRHYQRIADGYMDALRHAMAAGQVEQGDANVLAWCLMGIGELVGMRWILWDNQRHMPTDVFEEVVRFIERGLGIGRDRP